MPHGQKRTARRGSRLAAFDRQSAPIRNRTRLSGTITISSCRTEFRNALRSATRLSSQEHQKTLRIHGLNIRPDIVIHEPFDPLIHANRRDGNYAVFELALRGKVLQRLQKISPVWHRCSTSSRTHWGYSSTSRTLVRISTCSRSYSQSHCRFCCAPYRKRRQCRRGRRLAVLRQPTARSSLELNKMISS